MSTLHDFTLTLLSDPASGLAFLQDPEGVLTDAGLGGITADDVYEILPLVLDSVPPAQVESIESLLEVGDITGVEHLKLITEHLSAVGSMTDVASEITSTSAVTALVKDFSDVGDISDTLDANTATDITSTVTDVVYDNEVVAKVAGTDLHNIADLDVKDVLNDPSTITKVNVTDTEVLTDNLDNLDNTIKAHDLVNVGDVDDVAIKHVVHDVNVSDIGHSIDIADDVLKGGILSGNDADIHF